MDRDWLAARLQAGESIQAIARAVARHPSTVSYWVNRHGLLSAHTDRHAARGGIPRDVLAPLVDCGMSIRQIARELDRSPGTIRHWLRHYDLKTVTARRVRRDGSTAPEVIRDCPKHGWPTFRRLGAQTHYRCARCVVEAVSERRRRLKEVLVDEAGGRCELCGYSRCRAALQFHHVDPASKHFDIAGRGITRSIERMRAEARKRILLCANCHAEVEAGVSSVPLTSDSALSGPILGRRS
jgi:transposase-like protein